MNRLELSGSAWFDASDGNAATRLLVSVTQQDGEGLNGLSERDFEVLVFGVGPGGWDARIGQIATFANTGPSTVPGFYSLLVLNGDDVQPPPAVTVTVTLSAKMYRKSITISQGRVVINVPRGPAQA